MLLSGWSHDIAVNWFQNWFHCKKAQINVLVTNSNRSPNRAEGETRTWRRISAHRIPSPGVGSEIKLEHLFLLPRAYQPMQVVGAWPVASWKAIRPANTRVRVSTRVRLESTRPVWANVDANDLTCRDGVGGKLYPGAGEPACRQQHRMPTYIALLELDNAASPDLQVRGRTFSTMKREPVA